MIHRSTIFEAYQKSLEHLVMSWLSTPQTTAKTEEPSSCRHPEKLPPSTEVGETSKKKTQCLEGWPKDDTKNMEKKNKNHNSQVEMAYTIPFRVITSGQSQVEVIPPCPSQHFHPTSRSNHLSNAVWSCPWKRTSYLHNITDENAQNWEGRVWGQTLVHSNWSWKYRDWCWLLKGLD